MKFMVVNKMKAKITGYTFYKYSVITFLMLISAINFNMFINTTKTVSGGTNGISIIFEQLFDINPSISILVLSSLILLITLLNKQYEQFISAAYASLIYPLFVSITANASRFIEIRSADIFIIVVFSGLISGVVSGIICKYSMSQGGIILLSQIIAKKHKRSISSFNYMINLLIVIAGGFIFGTRSIVYAIVFLMANKIIMDKIIVETSRQKMFQIITTEDQKVKDYITKEIGSGCTTFSVRGITGYKNKTVIMTAVTNRNYFRLKEAIRSIDSKAFFLVTDSYQVYGGK
mgnify:CR=1 FL=1